MFDFTKEKSETETLSDTLEAEYAEALDRAVFNNGDSIICNANNEVDFENWLVIGRSFCEYNNETYAKVEEEIYLRNTKTRTWKQQ